jgi:hypothetical protein
MVVAPGITTPTVIGLTFGSGLTPFVSIGSTITGQIPTT